MNKEKIVIALISIIALVLANFTLIYPSLNRKDGYTYLNRSVYNSEDTYTYISFIEQSRQGRLLFENLYTTEPQTPALFRPSYLILGKIAAATSTSSELVFNISRILLSIVFFIVIYKFICKFFDKSAQRIACFFIILLSSGFGKTNWVVESLTFFSLGEAPHFILSQILMVSGFSLILDFIKTKNYKLIGFSSLLFLLLTFEHPFNLIVIAPTVFVALLLSGLSITFSATVAFLSSFGILYQYFEINRNPVLSAWQAQNKLYSPSITDYLIGYGLLTPFAIFGIEDFVNKKEIKHKFILVWIFVTLVAIYLPFSFQRRLIEGLHIPLSILATSGIFYLSNKIGKYKMDLITFGSLILIAGTLYSLKTGIDKVQNNSMQYYYYIDNSELEAIGWLRENSDFNDSILANRDYGNIIPGFTGRKTYTGHDIQTTDINTKINQINSFLLEADQQKAYQFLKDNSLTYIFLGKNDAMTKYGFTPEFQGFLSKVYEKNGVTIYKVIALKN